MKKKALATKMAAFVMAGAMTLGMGFPALASEMKLEGAVQKVVTTDGNTFAPNTTFSFTIVPRQVEEDNINKTGVEGGLTFSGSSNEGSIEFKSNGTLTDILSEYNGETDLYINKSKFTEPGKYHYTISETTGTYEGISYDTNTYDVIVHAYYDQISDSELSFKLGVNKDDKYEEVASNKAEIKFTNKYGDNNPNSTVKSLEIQKLLSGNMASYTDEFTVKIKIDRDETAETKEYYKVVKNAKDGTTSEEVFESGVEKTLEIKGGDKIKIYGLTSNDKVKVYEVVTNGKTENGYTPSYATASNAFRTAATGSVDTGYTVSVKTANNESGEATFEITNNKEATTPTGIVTEYAPYIVLVAAAGTFAVLFLRKRKEEF